MKNILFIHNVVPYILNIAIIEHRICFGSSMLLSIITSQGICFTSHCALMSYIQEIVNRLGNSLMVMIQLSWISMICIWRSISLCFHTISVTVGNSPHISIPQFITTFLMAAMSTTAFMSSWVNIAAKIVHIT